MCFISGCSVGCMNSIYAHTTSIFSSDLEASSHGWKYIDMSACSGSTEWAGPEDQRARAGKQAGLRLGPDDKQLREGASVRASKTSSS